MITYRILEEERIVIIELSGPISLPDLEALTRDVDGSSSRCEAFRGLVVQTRVWTWFNRLLGESVKPGARFEHAASGAKHRSYCIPKAVLADGHVVRFQPLRHHAAVRHQVDDYFSETRTDRTVELYECLHGPQRAVVFVHEVTHAIHSAAKLRTRDTRDRFVSAQVTGWLQFVKHNPSAWMWLVATIREQAQFEPLALLS